MPRNLPAPPLPLRDAYSYDGRIFTSRDALDDYIADANRDYAESVVFRIIAQLAPATSLPSVQRCALLVPHLDELASAVEQLEAYYNAA